MRRITFYIHWIICSFCLIGQSYGELSQTDVLVSEMTIIQQNPQQMIEAVAAGKERALLCGNCHGKNGNSVRDYIPNLASQNAAYLFNQFEKFANGERKDYVMSRLAKNLTREDRVNIALYFSQMQVEARDQPVASSAEGEKIYKGLCFTCHQQDGHGNGNYPRIAGQPYEYLKRTLNSFAGGNDRRANSPMAVIVKNLNEKQLLDVAAYVASMP
jgi:cytochrome c553|tara:strand:- start:5138 stop:5782 length:645 start_codon:yes stop_codon:yes gene_type:complete